MLRRGQRDGMKALFYVATLALGMLSPSLAQAQPRIGLLWLESDITPQGLAEIREVLREQGYVEGQNVRFEQRVSVAGYERLPAAAAELVQLRVDAIVSWGDTATRAAAKATSSIPIVMLAASDPVASGLAASLSRPGGNVTGIASLGQALMEKRLELLKEMVPGAQRIAILLNRASKGEIESLEQAEAAAPSFGLHLHVAEARTAKDIEPAIKTASRAGVGALLVVPSTMLRANRARIVEVSASHRLPTVFPDSSYVEVGGLLSYGRDTRYAFRLVAAYVAKILKGAKPADMPIEQVSKLELVVNAKTAKALGITIPNSILLRAHKVIE